MAATFADELRDRRLSHAMRWHLKPTVGQPESLAEHAGMVARISLLIGLKLEEAGLPVHWRDLLGAAITHDDPELVTGDMPGNFKRREGVREVADRWEASAVAELYGGLGDSAAALRGNLLSYIGRRDPLRARREYEVVKLADTISALSYAEQQLLIGNGHYASTRKLLADEIWAMIAKAEGDGWLDALDHDWSLRGWVGAARSGGPVRPVLD